MVGSLARLGAIAAATLALLAFAEVPGAPRANACGVAGPFDFDTVEAEDYVGTYARAIELVAAGKAVTSTVIVDGEEVDLRYQGVAKGPRNNRTTTLNTETRIPPVLFKAIVWLESHWNNTVDAVPYGGVGPVIRSFDCGYGLAQVTTGMSNTTGYAAAKQAAIGTHFVFNLAEGVRILADKWNSAPKFRPIAGDGDPAMLEDWYFAVWSYNGFAWSNHPANPDLPALRPALYHCEQEGAEGYGEFYRSDFTYQELVYGCVQNPPKRGPIGNPGGNPKVAFWAPQQVNMPDRSLKGIASAFDPEVFIACAELEVAACAKMDFPTTILKPEPAIPPVPTETPEPTASPEATETPTDTPEGEETPASPTGTRTPTATPTATMPPVPPILPHKDTTARVDAGLAKNFLGSPKLVFTGAKIVELRLTEDGRPESVTVTIENTGGGIGPFRVRTSAPWIRVLPSTGSVRTLDGGVAVGKDTEVVIQQAAGNKPRIAQKGHKSTLVITFDPDAMSGGQATGKVWIESSWGARQVFEVALTALVTPPDPYPFRSFVPFLTGP